MLTFLQIYNANSQNEVLKVQSYTATLVNKTIPITNIQEFIYKACIEVPKFKEGPVNVYEVKLGEEMAFPWLFLHGINE